MRIASTILLSTLLLACGPSDMTATPDAAEPEPDAAAFVDARPRPDAAPQPDAPLGGSADAAPTPDATPAIADAAPTPDAPPPTGGGLADGDFSVTEFDSANLVDKCSNLIPWGAASWGLNAETYTSATTTVAGARFRATNGQGYLYIKEDDGQYAIARFTQGDVYGANSCGTTPWNGFEPIAMAGKNVDVGISLFRDTDTLTLGSGSWVSMAITAWFTSPNMPKAGPDILGKAPLALDLIFHRECNTAVGCDVPANTEFPTVYQFQKFVAQAPSKAWFEIGTSLSDALAEAIDHFNLDAAASTMKLYQIEFQITVRNAEGAASLDDFVLNVAD